MPAAEIAEVLSRAGDRPPDGRLARDARVPEEGRPDQRRPGRDRQLLSVKPIIAVEHGVVETADKSRTRSKSRERCIELI